MVFWEALRQLVDYRRLKGTAGPMSNFHAGWHSLLRKKSIVRAGCFDLMTLLGCKAPQPHFSPLVCYGAWRDCLCHVKSPFSNFQTRELWRKKHVRCLSSSSRNSRFSLLETPPRTCRAGKLVWLRRCTTTRTSSAFSPSPRSNEGTGLSNHRVWKVRVKLLGSSRCFLHTLERNYSRYKGGWFPHLVGSESSLFELWNNQWKASLIGPLNPHVPNFMKLAWNLENDLLNLHDWRGSPVHLLNFLGPFFQCA